MKFWKKIFLSSVVLGMVLYCIAGVVLVEKNHAENLHNVIRTAVNKYTDIEYSLYLNVDYLIYTDFSEEQSLKTWLQVVINGYTMHDEMGKYQVEVFSKDNRQIMSDLKLKIQEPRKEIMEAESSEKLFLIREIDGKAYIFVSSLINLNNTEVKLVMSKCIEDVYRSKERDYRFFAVVGTVMLLVLAVAMYIISKRLTEPIVRLSEATRDIEKGDYSIRVEESNHFDEIGLLEKNFNAMLDVINHNVEQLKYNNESKQRFIDSLNHEIKTPITSIIGYSDLLLKGKVNEEVRVKSLNYINQEAKRLEFLNNTLLSLMVFREEEKKQDRASLAECVHHAVDALKFKLEKYNVSIQLELEDGFTKGDEKQFEILLINLLDNAMKASKDGDRIEVTGKRKDSDYVLKIKDFGIGIPEEDLDKICEPFYMVDKARTRKQNGVGLGLAICQEICQRYQINFLIESELNQGTEITLKFHMESTE